METKYNVSNSRSQHPIREIVFESTTAFVSSVTSVNIKNDSLAKHNGTAPECLDEGGLDNFQGEYGALHGYIAVIVCVFGILANFMNVIVLTRQNMRSSTNAILTGLAVSDGLTMLVYLPFAIQFYCLYGSYENPLRNTFAAASFLLFYANFSIVIHSVSTWLTVTLAIFRYLYIGWPRKGQLWCNRDKAKLAIVLNYLVCPFFCIPQFVSLSIKPNPNPSESYPNQTIYTVFPKQETESQRLITGVTFWVHAIFLKLMPCAILAVMSILLVKGMRDAERRRQHLSSSSGLTGSRRNESGTDSRARKTNRTTRMLLVVVALFVLTEMPPGIINLVAGVDQCVFHKIYNPLGDLFDILALINNGINFILYCTMSKQFRKTFCELFFKPIQDEARKFTVIVNQDQNYATNGNTFPETFRQTLEASSDV